LLITYGSPNVIGESEDAALTTHSPIWAHRTMASWRAMVKREPRVTTVQLSPETRDRLYRLKFRKTYDEFLRELCDLYEASSAQK
jgi:hypothetical protein